MERENRHLPRARTEELLVEELGDEVLVYDQRRDRAHCLNRTAALVWRACDGKTTVADAAARIERELAVPAGEPVVWMALDRLERARLLAEPVKLSAPRARFSRREVVRALGIAGGLSLVLPAVESIVAPLAAQAATCIPLAQCLELPPTACTGLPICEDRTLCCRRRGRVCLPRSC